MQKLIGVDVGGSKIRLGVLDEQGKILRQAIQETEAQAGFDRVLHQLKSIIQSAIDREVVGIGVGVPGPVDFGKGMVEFCPNLPGWENVALKEILFKEFRLPVLVDNDANCALAGEMWQGAGRGKKDVCLLTLGTGIGGAVAIDGQIYRGAKGMAAEFGHMILDPEGPQCNCGQKGCLEAFWQKRVSQDDWVTVGIVNLWKIFDPEVVIIGGGAASDLRVRALSDKVKKYSRAKIAIEMAKLGEQAGVVGAARMAKERIL